MVHTRRYPTAHWCRLCIVVAVIVSACRLPLSPSDGEKDALSVAVACNRETAQRKYTAEWSALSDAELRAEIELACGRVFIGFKEAGAARGVDPLGRVLVRDSVVAAVKAQVHALGVEFEWEAIDMPMVTARMPAQLELVRKLRAHPNVDYLEPIFPGTYSGMR